MFAITSDPGTDKTYIIGDEIEFTLTYDKNLSIGGTDTTKAPGYITYQTEWADDDPFTDHPSTKACVIGTDTTTLVCTDTVEEGHYDTDGIAVLANALTDLFSLSFFAGPLGQRVTNNNQALATDSNHKIDGVRPELTGARPSADKTKITLTFSEAIGAVDRTKITFDSGGTTLTTTAHSTSGSEVEITLTTALGAMDTNVTVALAADAVADAVGNGNAVLAASPIVDETAPTLSMTSTPSNTEVLLTYNEPLDPDSIPETSAFTVWANANEILSATLTVRDTGSGFLGCSNVNIGLPSGDRCSTPSTLTDDAFSYDGTDYEVEVIELKAGTLAIETDLVLTAAALADLTLNVGATSLAFADASHTGLSLSWTSTGLTWSQGETIALSIGGGTARTARTVSTAALSGTSGIVLTLSPAFRPGDALTVSYTVPETNPIQDIAGNDAAALADQAVSNTLDATAPEAVASLTASNTSTFGKVDLQWSGGTWANGSAITRHEVRYGAPIWSATLTVKDLGSNFLGCDTSTNQGCEPGELLTDNAFSYDSVDYLIDTIDLIGGQLRLITNRSTITAAALADLTLHVGALSFPFADATHSAGALTWTGAGLSWSEDDMVPLAISTISSLPWTSISDSAPGEANETSHTLEGLDPGEEYTFEVRAVNDVGGGGEASDTLTLLAPEWSFTLHDSGGNDITELTEGGDSATATVKITNSVRFGADQTVTLMWGTRDITAGLIVGDGGATTITITAGQSSGTLEISAPELGGVVSYWPPITQAFTALYGGTEIGSIDLTFMDDESVPVASITDAPTTVNEGENIEVESTLTPPLGTQGFVNFAVTDEDSALTGTLPTDTRFIGNQLTQTVTLTTDDNTAQNDGVHEVTFALELNSNFPYTLGTTSSVTIEVRDDDTPPLAVGDLRAQAGNTEATLRWDAPAAPTPDHGQPILHYEYRVKVGTGSFGSWAMIPNSDGTTTSHKFTGLTNGTEYTYEVRAENVAGDGAEVDVSVTPRVGVAVSFGAASASITEGGSSAVTLTLGEAPATGVTVTVPITATTGAGLGATEYSGVPTSVTFAAGETSKSFTVAVADDTLDEPDEELTLELGTLPDGYVPGTNGELVITVVDDDVAEWGLTLTGSNGSAVTELTEGGASATARVSITNNVRFETDQTITLEWGGQEITSGLIQGASGERDHHHHRRAIERHARRQRPAAPGRPVSPAGDRGTDRHARRGPDRRRHPARIRRRRGPTRTHHPPEGHQGRRERLGVPGRNALAGIRLAGANCLAARPGHGGNGQDPLTRAEYPQRTAGRTPQFRTGTDHEPLEQHDAHRQLDGGGPRHDRVHHPVEPGLLHHRHSVDGDAADPGR